MRDTGVEFSQIEREFTFRRENAGFVRYDVFRLNGIKERVILLDPSLVMRTTKREFFLPYDDVELPPARQPVQLHVVDEKEVIVEDPTKGREDSWQFAKAKVKYFDSWELVDLRKILRKEPHPYSPAVEKETSLFTKEDLLLTFQAPFKGDKTLVDFLTLGLAVFVHSSPPWMGEQGGVLEGALGKAKHLSALRYVIDLIPREFKRKTSSYYYQLARNSWEIRPPSALEASLCYFNPSIGVHLLIPMAQELVRVEAKKDYAKRLSDVISLMRARIVDSIHIVPRPTRESLIEDAIEKVVDLARDYGIPSPIEFSGVAP